MNSQAKLDQLVLAVMMIEMAHNHLQVKDHNVQVNTLMTINGLLDFQQVKVILRDNTMTEIYRRYLANRDEIIRFTLMFLKLVFSVMLNNFRDIMRTSKLSVRSFMFVPTTKPMIFYVQMAQYLINNILYAYGGISLIVIQLHHYSI